jgi:hypothetical protein
MYLDMRIHKNQDKRGKALGMSRLGLEVVLHGNLGRFRDKRSVMVGAASAVGPRLPRFEDSSSQVVDKSDTTCNLLRSFPNPQRLFLCQTCIWPTYAKRNSEDSDHS